MEFLAEIKGLDFISELFIKSTFILTLTFILIYFFRKKSASIQHFLLSVSLICLLLIPFLSSLTKGWETGLLPTWQTGEIHTQNVSPWDKLGKSTSTSNSITPSPADQQPLTQVSKNDSHSNFFLSKYSISKGIFGLILVTIWSAGLLVLLSRIFVGLIGAHKLTSQGQKISGSSWWQLLNHFLNKISIKRKINLFSHKNVNVPLTWGVIKPVVILPSESRNWSQDQRSSALFHELSHIKRGDFLLNILARCSVALYWFNPLCWFAFKMMKKEQEKACDELVLKTGVKPSTYAVNLLSLKKSGQFQWNPPSAALGAVGKSQLNERLIAILKQQLKPRETNMKTKIILSSLIIVTIAFIGLARPSQSEASTDNIFSQEKQIKKTAIKTTKKESEEKDVKTISWVSEDGETIEFIIKEGVIHILKVEGDSEIQFDSKSGDNTFTLQLDDKHLVLKKDDESNWTIQEGDKEAVSLYISTSNKKDKDYVVYQIKGDESNKNYNVLYKKKGDKDGKNAFYITAPKVHIEKLDKPYARVDIHVAPHVDIKMAPNVSSYNIHRSGLDQEELKEKLAKITERLKEIREDKNLEQNREAHEEALKEVEEMVKKLSEELKETSIELKDISLSLHTDVEDLHIDEDHDVIVDIEKIHEHKSMAFVSSDEGEFNINIKSHFDSNSKSKYEDIVKKLQKDLPEGYTVESIIDEEAETFTINIKATKSEQKSEIKIKEILEDLKKQLSSIK